MKGKHQKEPDHQETIIKLALVSAILSLITQLIGLIDKLIK